MLNETHRAPPRYKISDFFSSLLDVKADAIDLAGPLDAYIECKKDGKAMVGKTATLQLHAVSDAKFVGLFGVIDSGCSATLTPITFTSK